MTTSSGNSHQSAVVDAQWLEPTAEVRPTKAEVKLAYSKPMLRRLGLLRSITGSDLKW